MSAERNERPDGGFTLVELMLALVIFSFAVAGVLSVAVSSTRAFREQRRAIAIETSTRAPMTYLVDAVRGASPAVVSGSKIGFGDTCAEVTATNVSCSTCFPSSGALLVKDNTSAPDELHVIYAAGGVVKTTYNDITSSSTYVDISDTTDFSAGDTIMIANDTMATMRTVDSVSTGRLTFTAQASCGTPTNAWPATGYAKGSILLRVQYAKFTIGTLSGETIPMLMMNGEPVAEGVEDMQLSVGVDTNDDGTVTDAGTTTDEWIGNAAAEAIPSTYKVRALKIVLVARDTSPVLGPAAFTRPAALNRSAGSADNFRRRVLFSTVDIRNLNLTGS
jgi:prepilin-type N-terminal cleavage/methylation domain-containing protein